MLNYRFGNSESWLKNTFSYPDLVTAISSSSNIQDRFLYIYNADTLLWVGNVEPMFKELYMDAMSDNTVRYWSTTLHSYEASEWTWHYKYYLLLDEAKRRSLPYFFEVLSARIYRAILDYTGVPYDRLSVLAGNGQAA